MAIPDNCYMNICKVFQEVYKNKFEYNKVQQIEVGSRGKTMTCEYIVKAPEELQNSQFSYYDAVVYDAVYTIYRTHTPKFTLTDLIRVMTGDEKIRFYRTKNGIQKREQRLRDSLYRLMHTCIAIKYNDEVIKRQLKDENGQLLPGYSGDYMLPLATEANGTTFWFLEERELPLYKYAEDIRQIISIPKEFLSPVTLLQTLYPEADNLLEPADFMQEIESVFQNDTDLSQASVVEDTPAYTAPEITKLLKRLDFSCTDEIMLLKRLLIQRLEIMGNSKNNVGKRKIRYYGSKPNDGIFPLADIRRENFTWTEPFASDRGKVRSESRGWKNKVHTVNEKICAILDAYKQCGYITDYALLRAEPRALVRGIEILGDIQRPELHS